jgi:hypothetical protein
MTRIAGGMVRVLIIASAIWLALPPSTQSR